MLNFISIKSSDNFGRTDGKSFDGVRILLAVRVLTTENFPS